MCVFLTLFIYNVVLFYPFSVVSQRDAMEDSVEVVIEKLLNATKDVAPKVNSHLDEVIMLKISLPSFLMCYIVQVANEAEHCLTMVLSLYDPFRCLSVSSCVSFEFA